MRVRKIGRKPRRSRVIWLGTVKIRRRCCMCWEDNADSGELSEIVDEAAADFAGEEFVHGGDGAAGFVEGTEVDAADGDAGGVEAEEFAPDFFFGGVKADDDDGVGFHGGKASLQSGEESGKRIVIRVPRPVGEKRLTVDS